MQKVLRTKLRWTEIEKSFLIENSSKMKDEEIATHLRKTLKSIREMRRRMGLIKRSGRGIVALRESN